MQHHLGLEANGESGSRDEFSKYIAATGLATFSLCSAVIKTLKPADETKDLYKLW